jgi:MFS transporter, MHS family, proline/betaine transporter
VLASRQTAGRSSPRRALVAACVGNAVEWYDFALYGAFATILAVTFFPSEDRGADLLATFAVFSTAFIFRPVGALLFGRRGDRSGRRQLLVLMIIVMSLATAGVGMLPGYASIGLLGPVLLVVLRVAQGLSAGGEAAAASAFAVEYAPVHRRGWYGGWVWATLALGLAAATGTAALLAWWLPPATLEAWAWRAAFLVALPIGLVGLYLRLRPDETPSFQAIQRTDAVAQRPVRDVLAAYPGQMLAGLALVAAASLSFNTSFVYLPNQLVTERGLPLSRALAGALLGLVVMGRPLPPSGASPIGWAADHCWPPGRSACSGSPCRSTCSSAKASRSASCSGTWCWGWPWAALSCRRSCPSCSPPGSDPAAWRSPTGWAARCSGGRPRS